MLEWGAGLMVGAEWTWVMLIAGEDGMVRSGSCGSTKYSTPDSNMRDSPGAFLGNSLLVHENIAEEGYGGRLTG